MVEDCTSLREAIFFMRSINNCIDEIVKQVDNKSFKSVLFMQVSYPLKNVLNSYDEWHDMERGMNAITGQKMS